LSRDNKLRQAVATGRLRFPGEQVELLAKAVKVNHDAARQAAELAARFKDATAEAETANRGLRQIATRIEAHAGRSKWDFAVLAAGMAVAALLAGAGAVYIVRPEQRVQAGVTA
jgi:hypothetical protein